MYVKASALYYTIVISLLIAIIVGALVLLVFNYRTEVQLLYIDQTLQTDALSGINIILADSSAIKYGETKTVNLYGDTGNVATLTKKSWGLYTLGISTTNIKARTVTRVAIIGNSKPDSLLALYLVNHDRELSVCGNTVIKGNAMLPAGGIKRAYIEGQNYTGSSLVYGNTSNSNKQLPIVDSRVIEPNVTYFGQLPRADSVVLFKGNVFNDSLIGDFKNKTIDLVPTEPLRLGSSATISGNAVIVSAFPITIDANAHIQDALLYAPSITIEDGFEGSLQAFATDSILVGQNANLRYPSSLALLKNPADTSLVSKKSNRISIAVGAKVSGVVFISVDYNQGKMPVLDLAKDAQASGIVYVNGMVQIIGKVSGSLYCDKFYLKTPSSVYENCLLNTEINSTDLPKYYCLSGLIPTGNNMNVIKWLQ